MLKRLLKYLKKPGPVFTVCVFTISLILIVGSVVLTVAGTQGGWVYAVYAFAAAGLAYGVYLGVTAVPSVKRAVSKTVRAMLPDDSPLLDYGYRTVITAVFSLAIDLGYSVFLIVMAVLYDPVWYGSLAAYYVLLGAIRAVVIRRDGRRGKGAPEGVELQKRRLKTYGICGAFLVALSAAMSVAVAQMVVSGRGSGNPEWVVIAIAAYTFYKAISAIANFVKAKKRDDLTAKALRVIGLSDALVSVMSLENAMLSAFGEGDELFVLKAVTGFAVCALTVALGAVMSVSGYTGYKKLLRGEVAVEESENEGSSEDGEDGSEG